MKQTNITADNTVFILLSFEGPDPYSLAGGLGVRVNSLSRTLAEAGFPTHLFFVGDPKGKGEEASNENNLTLHRWCQWISEYYPNGVYQGENEKLYDFSKSIPPFVIENIVESAVKQDKLVIILGEEWHTAEAMCRLGELLRSKGVKDRVVMFWNANNTFGFERIDWESLADNTTLTTVSRYMKHIMRELDLNPLVIPNGIPKSLLTGLDVRTAAWLRKSLNVDLVLTKVARWDPHKGWNEAVEATAQLKARGPRTLLIARGGIEPYGEEVLNNARSLGIAIKEARAEGNTLKDFFSAIRNHDGADILNIKFYCPQEFLRILYHASDAVLANSGHEPFGLVGLEAMAAKGVAFTGGTCEDYAIPFHNSIVLETSDPREIEDYVLYLESHPWVESRIRKAAWETAKQFTWEEVTKNLIQKLAQQARIQGALDTQGEPATEPEPEYSETASNYRAAFTGSLQK